LVPNNSSPLFNVNVIDPYHFLLMLQTIMLVDVIDPKHFLSMLQTKKLVDVKIFDLNTPTLLQHAFAYFCILVHAFA
jgi:hypothetical protein